MMTKLSGNLRFIHLITHAQWREERAKKARAHGDFFAEEDDDDEDDEESGSEDEDREIEEALQMLDKDELLVEGLDAS